MSLAREEPIFRKPVLKPEAVARLTPREAEVTQWLGEGKTLEEIGIILDRSPRTMGKHRDNCYWKLEVCSRVELVLKWFDLWMVGQFVGEMLPMLAQCHLVA